MSRFLLVARLHQGQGVFGQIRGDAGVDELDLVGLAFEGCVEPAPQHIEIAFIDQADGLFCAGELGQEAVAVVQLIDQCATLGADLADFPLAAAVEQRQLSLIPMPFAGQSFQQRALPALGAAVASELAVDLQVQRATNQLQPFRLVARGEVFLDTPVHDHVRIQFIQIQLVGEHGFFEAQAQALHLRVFAGVDLGQQQLEHRFIG
ncbi:hypothetical protein D3C87_1119140 [compost metagenome]